MVDTIGGCHHFALATITRLGRQLARNEEHDTGEMECHLRQMLVVLLDKGNVTMLVACTPTFAQPEVERDLDKEEPGRALVSQTIDCIFIFLKTGLSSKSTERWPG